MLKQVDGGSRASGRRWRIAVWGNVCVSDGLFTESVDGRLQFIETQVDVAAAEAVQAKVCQRVLAALRRRGWLEADAAHAMAQWNHGGGFSVDASVRIEGNDRQALERLLRYCARPCWAAERLHETGDGAHLIYMLPKPGFDGLTQITIRPLELLDRLVPVRGHASLLESMRSTHCAACAVPPACG